MTTASIIDELNHLSFDSFEDYFRLDRLDELMVRLPENPDGQLTCEAMLNVLERYLQMEFGTSGQLIRTLESYRRQYESSLLASLYHQPTAMTVWLLNPLINAATDPEKNQLIAKLDRLRLRTHPRADAQDAAKEFYRFQVP